MLEQLERTTLQEEPRQIYNIVGTRRARCDADLKVSGTAVFGTDVKLPNLLHGKILRSVYPHARIIRLDLSKVKDFPGVRAVVVAEDFPNVTYGFAVKDQRILATNSVLYVGQPICALAADSLEIAEAAISEIVVEYEPLPSILTIEEGLRDNSIPIHPNATSLGSHSFASKNIATYTRVHRGNVEEAMKKADFVVEEEYQTQQVHQSYIEPHASTADFNVNSGKLKVWTSTQSPFWVRNSLALILGMRVSQIEVIATHTGGGFGAKILSQLEPICAILSQKAGRPVKIISTREEEFTSGTPRPPIHFWIESGVKGGKIIARRGRAVVDTGASASEGAIYANIAALQLVGPYNIPNVETEGISCYTNKQPAGAFRAPGTMETNFAVESHTDMLAAKARIDPLEFRLLNVWKDGDSGPTGQIMKGVGLCDALNRAAKKIGYGETGLGQKLFGQTNVRTGIGMACGFIPSVGIHSSAAYVKLNEDGSVTLITGAQDTGSGAVTGLAMIVAEELNVRLEDIIVQPPNTDFAPWDGGSQGSRTTYTGGNAVLLASRNARKRILEVASQILQVDTIRLQLKDGIVCVPGSAKSIKLSDLAMVAQSQFGGPIIGSGSFVQGFPSHDKSSIDGFDFVTSFHDPTFVAHLAKVEVDVLTGKVKVTRYVAAQDLGYSINPLGAEGQIQGGTVQGIGYALYEKMHNESGLIVNPNFGEYKLPTTMDVPPIEPIIIEGHFGAGPYGAKGVGEANIVPPAAAIANAIFNAIGVRLTRLPMTPETVLDSLNQICVTVPRTDGEGG